jgi:hypothetical protein
MRVARACVVDNMAGSNVFCKAQACPTVVPCSCVVVCVPASIKSMWPNHKTLFTMQRRFGLTFFWNTYTTLLSGLFLIDGSCKRLVVQHTRNISSTKHCWLEFGVVIGI